MVSVGRLIVMELRCKEPGASLLCVTSSVDQEDFLEINDNQVSYDGFFNLLSFVVYFKQPTHENIGKQKLNIRDFEDCEAGIIEKRVRSTRELSWSSY
jgi:hypothetical protein